MLHQVFGSATVPPRSMAPARRRSPASPSPLRSRRADAGLPDRLRQLLAETGPHEPLPTTRELGLRLGVANTTVFRALRRLAEAGEIWQQPGSGRYFPAGARLLLDRPKPVACLIRRLELGSELYRELLEGISAGCGAGRRTMLLWHDELLVNHPDPAEPPRFAPVAQQRAILEDFLARHGDAAGGYVLDHVWSDEALQAFADRLQPAVVLFRTCAVAPFGNVRADFRAGAFKAVGHLLGRGFERILPVHPFDGDPAVDEFAASLRTVADELGCADRLLAPAVAATAPDRRKLVQGLRRSPRRTALLCPEDNVAVLLRSALQESGIACPTAVGLLSVMGTDTASRAELSCLRYDFRQLGQAAVRTLDRGGGEARTFEPEVWPGATT